MPVSFTIIDDNPNFIVINKAPNIDFHTIDNQLGVVELVKQALNLETLYPVHRLDRMTSGLLILAKTKAYAALFGQLFEARAIDKYYLALSDKKPKKKQGLVKGDMTKGRGGSYLLLKSLENPAITQFFSFSIEPGIRGYVLKPHSGKTHQLRVAMKSIGAPILGDSRYYPNHQGCVGYLHAWQLSFELEAQHYRYVAAPDWPNNGVTPWLQELEATWPLPWPVLKGMR